MMTRKVKCTIHDHHLGWDNSLTPSVVAQPGDTISVEVLDASGGQLGRNATLDDLKVLDFGKINPVTGPVYLEGAEPGDALIVDILEFVPSGVGWTVNVRVMVVMDFPPCINGRSTAKAAPGSGV